MCTMLIKFCFKILSDKTGYFAAQYSVVSDEDIVSVIYCKVAFCVAVFAVCVLGGYVMSYWNRPFFPEWCSDATLKKKKKKKKNISKAVFRRVV